MPNYGAKSSLNFTIFEFLRQNTQKWKILPLQFQVLEINAILKNDTFWGNITYCDIVFWIFAPDDCYSRMKKVSWFNCRYELQVPLSDSICKPKNVHLDASCRRRQMAEIFYKVTQQKTDRGLDYKKMEPFCTENRTRLRGKRPKSSICNI